LVEIPADWGKLKEQDPGLAKAWRKITRETFERAFSGGWIAVDLVDWRDEQGRARTGYMMTKAEPVLFQI
jgi:predicted GNAT superfamily acetyltransferase